MKMLRAVMLAAVCATTTAATSASLRDVERSTTVSVVGDTPTPGVPTADQVVAVLPEVTVPETTAPDTTVPDTAAPETSLPESSMPDPTGTIGP